MPTLKQILETKTKQKIYNPSHLLMAINQIILGVVEGTKEMESKAKPIVDNTKAYIDIKPLVYSFKPKYI